LRAPDIHDPAEDHDHSSGKQSILPAELLSLSLVIGRKNEIERVKFSEVNGRLSEDQLQQMHGTRTPTKPFSSVDRLDLWGRN